MTKFHDRAAPGYEDVVGEIQRLANEGSMRSSEVERSKICGLYTGNESDRSIKSNLLINSSGFGK
jgi:hypothetical protein